MFSFDDFVLFERSLASLQNQYVDVIIQYNDSIKAAENNDDDIDILIFERNILYSDLDKISDLLERIRRFIRVCDKEKLLND